jgi:undecaprenyl-diphosphatase
MINSFDTFFLKFIPQSDSKLLELFSHIAAPKLHLCLWGILSIYVFYKIKLEVLNSKAFYLLKLTGMIMFFCGIIKITAGRARPFLLDEGIYGFTMWKTSQAYLSFPSSHSAIAIAFTYFFQKTYNLNKAIYLFPILIGLTRLSLDVHFATDVIAGLAVGLGISMILQKYYSKALVFFLKLIRPYYQEKQED